MLYAATVATSSTAPLRVEARREPFDHLVRNLDVARHRVRELEHQPLVVAPRGSRAPRAASRPSRGSAAPVPDGVHLRVRDARRPGVRNVRLELERRPIQHGHAQDDELAQSGGNARLLAHRRQELLPAGGNRCAVEQHLIEDRDVAALAQDRALDLGELRRACRARPAGRGSTVSSAMAAPKLPRAGTDVRRGSFRRDLLVADQLAPLFRVLREARRELLRRRGHGHGAARREPLAHRRRREHVAHRAIERRHAFRAASSPARTAHTSCSSRRHRRPAPRTSARRAAPDAASARRCRSP